MDSLYIAKIRRHEPKQGRHFPCVYTNFTENVHITTLPTLSEFFRIAVPARNKKIPKSSDFRIFFDLPFRVVGAEGVEPPTLCL